MAVEKNCDRVLLFPLHLLSKVVSDPMRGKDVWGVK